MLHVRFKTCMASSVTEEDADLQIRGGIEDNSKVTFSYFSMKIYVVTPHKNRLNETVLMVGHKIYSYQESLLIIP